MTTATLKQRIVALAGKAVMGNAPRQIQHPRPEENPAPQVDAILEARQTAQDFAARLGEIMQARDAFDAATARLRGSRHLDFASLVAAGQPLPAIEDFESDARRAEARLQALATLANREVENASTAVHVLRQAARHNVDAAAQAARDKVRNMLPPDVFADDDLEAVLALARPVIEASLASAEINKLADAAVPLRKAEMFGFTLPRFRTCALPARGMPGIEHHDEFNPAQVIADIHRVLEVQLRTIGFYVGVDSEPTSTRWTR